MNDLLHLLVLVVPYVLLLAIGAGVWEWFERREG